MTEHEILKNAFKHLSQGKDIVVPPGDDCAVLDLGSEKLLAVTVDQLIGDVHFKSGTEPEKIAVKLLRRNLSDIAACGAKPDFAVLTIAANFANGAGADWFERFFMAIGAEARKWDVSICGGDLAKFAGEGGPIHTSLTLFGRVDKDSLCLRSGASAGDVLFATGKFGNSIRSGYHLEFLPRIAEGKFLAGAWTNTMIDVSDGLLDDAAKIAEASALSFELFTGDIPLRQGADLRSALTEGEDYELVFAVSPENEEKLLRVWPFDTDLTRIGVFKKDLELLAMDKNGNNLIELYGKGYDHFKK